MVRNENKPESICTKIARNLEAAKPKTKSDYLILSWIVPATLAGAAFFGPLGGVLAAIGATVGYYQSLDPVPKAQARKTAEVASEVLVARSRNSPGVNNRNPILNNLDASKPITPATPSNRTSLKLDSLFRPTSQLDFTLNRSVTAAPLAVKDIGLRQSAKVEELKAKQANHLQKLFWFSQNGQWQHLREHTAHPDSGFDWWMFPTDRSSAGYGTIYQLNQGEIEHLMKDPVFMASYRKGVCLVAESWGFDIIQGTRVADGSRFWSNYQVRLGKMLHSLSLFKQDDLRRVLSKLLIETGIAPNLDEWIRKYLLSSYTQRDSKIGK